MTTTVNDDKIIFAALTLSKAHAQTQRAFSDVIYHMGATRKQQRRLMLDNLEIWEQLVSDDFEDIKRRFRAYVEARAKGEPVRV